jgi:hypothetical protein
MASFGVETEAQAPSSAGAAVEESEWLERCCASIRESDPLLAADDVLDLAASLWGLPRCQRLLPELAAGLLLADQLGRLD